MHDGGVNMTEDFVIPMRSLHSDLVNGVINCINFLAKFVHQFVEVGPVHQENILFCHLVVIVEVPDLGSELLFWDM